MYYGQTPNVCKDNIPKWIEIGRSNPWIRRAWDPQFTETSFAECETLSELHAALTQANWCVGTAFCIHYDGFAYAFINQVNGGDEWLVIRGAVPFESVSGAAAWKTVDEMHLDLHRWSQVNDERLRLLDFPFRPNRVGRGAF